MRKDYRERLKWRGDAVYWERRKVLALVRDDRYPQMWRVKMPDGTLTDMVNRTRARDAALSIAADMLTLEGAGNEAA